MKRLNRASRVLMLVLLAGVAASGCRQQTLKMKYEEHWQLLVPVLAPGDVIKWHGITKDHVNWGGNQSPCEDAPAGTDHCKIKKGTEGQSFSYKCVKERPCDPEIAVDDGLPIAPKATVNSAPPADIAVKVYCSTEGKLTLEPEGELRVGKIVGWRPMGSITNSNWTVTFEDQATACSDTSAITSPYGVCKLKTEGNFKYRFTSTGTACTSIDETLYVQK